MEALKLRAKIHSDTVEWIDPLPELPEGEVEVILLYEKKNKELKQPHPELPVLNGIRFLKKHFRREDIYNDNGR